MTNLNRKQRLEQQKKCATESSLALAWPFRGTTKIGKLSMPKPQPLMKPFTFLLKEATIKRTRGML